MNKIFLLGTVVLAFTTGLAWAKVGGGDISFEMKAAGKVVFTHERHVAGAGLACTDCHTALFTTKEKHKKTNMVQMRKGRSCGACHNGTKAFSVKSDCGRCHAK